jgi:hypothetical protein
LDLAIHQSTHRLLDHPLLAAKLETHRQLQIRGEQARDGDAIGLFASAAAGVRSSDDAHKIRGPEIRID